MTMNLFAQAVTTADTTPTKEKKGSNKSIIEISCAKELDELFELRSEIKDKTATMKMLEGTVKEEAKEHFFQQALKLKGKPDSFYLQGRNHKMLFYGQDKYISDVPSTFPQELTDTEVTYQVDTDIVAKYGDKLSEAIMKADIPEHLKAQVIKAVPKKFIKPGAINHLVDYPILRDCIIYGIKS